MNEWVTSMSALVSVKGTAHFGFEKPIGNPKRDKDYQSCGAI